jgi:hypothetical protein
MSATRGSLVCLALLGSIWAVGRTARAAHTEPCLTVTITEPEDCSAYCVNEIVHCSATAMKGGENHTDSAWWKWDFGDGSVVGPAPGNHYENHIYTAAGAYTVTATAYWPAANGPHWGSDSIQVYIYLVGIDDPDRIPPTKSVDVSTVIDPEGFDPVVFDVINNGGGNGSASVTANAERTTSGPITVTGGTQTDPGHSWQLQIRGTVGGTHECGFSGGFSVCAHPIGTVNGPPTPVNDASVGLIVVHTWLSDSGDPAHLAGGDLLVKELVSNSLDHTGCFVGMDPVTPWTSDWMSAEPYTDLVTIPRQLLIDRSDNQQDHSGTVSFLQLCIFYCQRCGMIEAWPEAVPATGFRMTHDVIGNGPGTRITCFTSKYPEDVSVGGYTTGGAPGGAGLLNIVREP